ncbi:MAG TPA: hypothetical protein VE326_11400 [Candidatus Binatia bacterium]|nr:hypothetical protein [Candidatus Binatia bacterium]
MLRLHLYWKRDSGDIDLGDCYHDVLPPVGSLISHTSPEHEGGVWRVALVYLHPAYEGSMAVRAVEMGRTPPDGQVGMVELFVEPAAGPHAP